MTRIRVEDRDAAGDAARLLRSALASRAPGLPWASKRPRPVLRAFANHHVRPSDEAMATGAAEDLPRMR
jgi:hypothetical protein